MGPPKMDLPTKNCGYLLCLRKDPLLSAHIWSDEKLVALSNRRRRSKFPYKKLADQLIAGTFLRSCVLPPHQLCQAPSKFCAASESGEGSKLLASTNAEARDRPTTIRESSLQEHSSEADSRHAPNKAFTLRESPFTLFPCKRHPV